MINELRESRWNNDQEVGKLTNELRKLSFNKELMEKDNLNLTNGMKKTLKRINELTTNIDQIRKERDEGKLRNGNVTEDHKNLLENAQQQIKDLQSNFESLTSTAKEE